MCTIWKYVRGGNLQKQYNKLISIMPLRKQERIIKCEKRERNEKQHLDENNEG